jgi:hypothetical protein
MASANIRAKIEKGLAKAAVKTGSSSSEKVYLIKRTNTGGSSPINPPVYTESKVLLVNAIFQSADRKLFDGDFFATDRQLVSDYSVEVNRGDIIEQGNNRYMVINQDVKAPTSDVLVYISQLRIQ